MIVACPHCGDTTEQETMLKEFVCGECDKPFAPPPLWKRGARPEELARVAAIDEFMRYYAGQAKLLARERALITGRALKRALYVPVKERKSPLEALRQFVKEKAAE